MPMIMATATTPRIVRVCAAFRPCGRRNALTPFEIASVPVSAEDPEAKVRELVPEQESTREQPLP